MRAITAILFLVASTPALAAEPWTPREVALEYGCISLALIDWGQTRYITRHLDRFHEHNPFLGTRPSEAAVNRYFAVEIGGHVLLVNALSHHWREPFQWGWIIAEGYAVRRNHMIGVKVDF